MKLTFNNISENPINLLRRAGYSFQRRDGDEMSFVRPFGQSGFPRFHIYTSTENGNFVISIHFDEKKETYGKATRHHGEYENDGVLKEEVQRLKAIIE